MAEDDKLLVVDGLAVKPRWRWSGFYRAEVRDSIRAQAKRGKDEIAAAEREYMAGYAKRHGLPCRTQQQIAAVRAHILARQGRAVE